MEKVKKYLSKFEGDSLSKIIEEHKTVYKIPPKYKGFPYNSSNLSSETKNNGFNPWYIKKIVENAIKNLLTIAKAMSALLFNALHQH